MISILAKRQSALLGLTAWCVACSVYQSSLLDSALSTGGSGGSNDVGGSSGGSKTTPDTATNTTDAGMPGDGGAPNPSGASGSAPRGGESAGPGPGGAPEGGGSGGGGTGGSGAPPERVLEPIDDMEDNDAFVLASNGRNGHWDVSNDATASATQAPPAAAFTMAELVDASRPESHFAAYTQGAGFKDWGAYMTVSMRTWPDYAQTPVYDASAYIGISFWAKVGAGSDTSLRVRYIGGQTDPRGGVCMASGTVATACYDHFFAPVKLSQDWQHVELLFKDFQQAGVGMSFPSIDLTKMYALELFFPGRKTSTGNAFELWVDDLSFIVQ
ncbi:MAG TPA: hypothetical protein VHB79_21140 [Polyangiaceae bacterium]|nr:hypothetical protein [Polyangiaceae bacterium]